MKKVLYEGKAFGGIVDCYVLDDKSRVISESGVICALTDGVRTDKNAHLDQLLSFLPNEFNYLKVSPDIEFSLKDGKHVKGITAERFYDILEACSEAALCGNLQGSQLAIVENCNRMIRALVRKGFAALADEAKGKQATHNAN